MEAMMFGNDVGNGMMMFGDERESRTNSSSETRPRQLIHINDYGDRGFKDMRRLIMFDHDYI